MKKLIWIIVTLFILSSCSVDDITYNTYSGEPLEYWMDMYIDWFGNDYTEEDTLVSGTWFKDLKFYQDEEWISYIVLSNNSGHPDDWENFVYKVF